MCLGPIKVVVLNDGFPFPLRGVKEAELLVTHSMEEVSSISITQNATVTNAALCVVTWPRGDLS